MLSQATSCLRGSSAFLRMIMEEAGQSLPSEHLYTVIGRVIDFCLQNPVLKTAFCEFSTTYRPRKTGMDPMDDIIETGLAFAKSLQEKQMPTLDTPKLMAFAETFTCLSDYPSLHDLVTDMLLPQTNIGLAQHTGLAH